MKKCNMDCFNCVHDDCINDYVVPLREYSEEERKYRRKKALERYYARKEKGLCVGCGERPPLQGATECLECRIKHRRRGKEYYIKTTTDEKNREYRREHGLCFFCGDEVVEGKKTCEKCYSQRKELGKKLNEHPNTVKHRETLKKWRY